MVLNDYVSSEAMARAVLDEVCPIPNPSEQDIRDAIHNWGVSQFDIQAEDTPLTVNGDREISFTSLFDAIHYLTKGDWGLTPSIDANGQITGYQFVNFVNVRYWQNPVSGEYSYDVFIDNESP